MTFKVSSEIAEKAEGHTCIFLSIICLVISPTVSGFIFKKVDMDAFRVYARCRLARLHFVDELDLPVGVIRLSMKLI